LNAVEAERFPRQPTRRPSRNPTTPPITSPAMKMAFAAL
jgi:hypothetical protein